MLHHNDPDTPTPCQQQSPELWFATLKRDRDRAKALCKFCMRKLDCLEEALELEKQLGQQLHGIHGGLDKKQRAGIAVRRITEPNYPFKEGAA